MEVILGRTGQVEEFVERRNERVAVDLADAVGNVRQIEQGRQGWGVFFPAFVAHHVLAFGQAQAWSGGRLSAAAAQAAWVRQALVRQFNREARHSLLTCIEN
jgi:hypothetical protein